MSEEHAEPVTIAGRRTIHEPGIYPDLEVDEYHADPVPEGSLSSSGARKLLAEPPALFKYELDNPPDPKPVFEIGHAAHRVVLGSGPELVKLPFDSLRTNAAKAFKAEATERGAIVLSEDMWGHVHAMADALREHPLAAALLDPDQGDPEQSLFWRDTATGEMLRARLDWLPHTDGGRLIVPDYKTARTANPALFPRSAADYGYHMQDDYYLEGIRAHELAAEVAFVFIVQEKTPPYLVSVCAFKDSDRALAHDQNRQAIELYHKCKTTGSWPGYDDIYYVDLPTWYLIQNGA